MESRLVRASILATAILFPAAARDARDPFLAQRQAQQSSCGGVLIDDLVLKGLVQTVFGYTAVLENQRDKKTYFLRANDHVFDGRVASVDSKGITFEFHRSVPDSASKPPPTRRLELHRQNPGAGGAAEQRVEPGEGR